MRSIMAVATIAILVALPAFAQAPSPNVPTPPSRPSAAPVTPATPSTLLDINSASKEQLQALKGIGPARADDIIKGRPYRGKDELLSRKLVPEGVYNDIRDQIVARQRS
jgi:DNA uptake protein ComE-like DNA-binding protein